MWSLGILLIKLMGLPHPFATEQDSPSAKLRERICTEPPRFDWRDLDGDKNLLGDLLSRILDKDPRKRLTVRLSNDPRKFELTKDP